jgi:hypothetical protein
MSRLYIKRTQRALKSINSTTKKQSRKTKKRIANVVYVVNIERAYMNLFCFELRVSSFELKKTRFWGCWVILC